MQLFSEIVAFKVRPGETIYMFAERIKRFTDHLEAMKEVMKETYLLFQLHRYLPPHFNGLVE